MHPPWGGEKVCPAPTHPGLGGGQRHTHTHTYKDKDTDKFRDQTHAIFSKSKEIKEFKRDVVYLQGHPKVHSLTSRTKTEFRTKNILLEDDDARYQPALRSRISRNLSLLFASAADRAGQRAKRSEPRQKARGGRGNRETPDDQTKPSKKISKLFVQTKIKKEALFISQLTHVMQTWEEAVHISI